jgi:hypothetical protein
MIQKPKIVPKPANTPQDELYYQAHGYLFNVVKMKIEKNLKGYNQRTFSIYLDDYSYELVFRQGIDYSKLKHALISQLLNKPEEPLWLHCYPQYSHKDKKFYFCLIYFSTNKPLEAIDKIFYLKGIWQHIPVLKNNYFTVYRNNKLDTEVFIKNLHLPLNWSKKSWSVNNKNIKAKFNVILGKFENNQLNHHLTLSESNNIPKRLKNNKIKKKKKLYIKLKK